MPLFLLRTYIILEAKAWRSFQRHFSWDQEHAFAMNHPVIPIAMMFAFWNSSNLKTKLKWKLRSLMCITRLTKSVHVRCSPATVLFHRSAPDIWHDLPIQTWPTVYLRGSASNWTHRSRERRISCAENLATHSKWKICITERLLTFCSSPRGSVILEKTTWTTLNISRFSGGHTTYDASTAFPQTESYLSLMAWSCPLLLLHLLENTAKAVRRSRRNGQLPGERCSTN